MSYTVSEPQTILCMHYHIHVHKGNSQCSEIIFFTLLWVFEWVLDIKTDVEGKDRFYHVAEYYSHK